MTSVKQIHISAAVILDTAERILLVRKHNTPWFMQPGGKIEAGEPAAAALMRELQEELNFSCAVDAINPLGRFTDIAANEPDHQLLADMFVIRTERRDFQPSAEIAEVRWIDAANSQQLPLAPLTGQQILPLVREMLGRR